MHSPRIQKASVVDDFTLRIEFTNNEVKQYDIRRLLSSPMFYPLRQPAFFRSFRVEEGGYGVAWNDEVDISEYELWKNGVSLKQDELNGDRISQ